MLCSLQNTSVFLTLTVTLRWGGIVATVLKIRIEAQKVGSYGISLEVQWLGLSAFTAMAQVHSLVGELRILQALW